MELVIPSTRKHTVYSFISPFADGYFPDGLAPLTKHELSILKVMEEVKNQKNWILKLQNEEIRKQLIADYKGRFDSNIVEYAFAELMYYSYEFKAEGVVPGPVDRTFLGDSIIDPKVADRFLKAVENFELALEREHGHKLERGSGCSSKGWYIGPNDQMQNLVDPSLYPLIYGVSRAVSTDMSVTLVKLNDWRAVMGTGEAVFYTPPQIDARNRSLYYDIDEDSDSGADFIGLMEKYRSKRYQWLPSEFDVSIDGKVKVLSYINNIYPLQHIEMYTAIESIFERFVPLFNKCLTESCKENIKPPRIKLEPHLNTRTSTRTTTNSSNFKPSFPLDNARDFIEYQANINNVSFDGKHGNDHKLSSEFTSETNGIKHAIDLTFIPENIKRSIPIVNLRGSRLQVIVKLVNIKLTPENPVYLGEGSSSDVGKGGVWHVEGIQNENIVATGIYYYDQKNVTDSAVAFRVAVREPNSVSENRGYEWVSKQYLLGHRTPLNQNLGRINTFPGRCIVYPNLYQRQVQPFKLQDESKPGYQKILYFYLVDPNYRIYSTANVPPQQKTWFRREVGSEDAGKIQGRENRLVQLPNLVFEKTFEKLGWPIDAQEAKRQRTELMKEREALVDKINRDIFERPFFP